MTPDGGLIGHIIFIAVLCATIVLVQRRLLYNPLAGTVHLLIFYGFIIITLGTIQLIAGGISSGLVLPAIGGNPVYQFILDVVAVFVLVACGVAAYRRLALRPPRLDNSGDAFVILGLIVLLMVSLLLMEAFGIRVGGSTTAAWSPVGGGLAMLFSGMSPPAATFLYSAFWWVHLLTVCAF